MFKIKDGYNLELQTPETMKLFGSTKKLIGKTKDGEIIKSLEVVDFSFSKWNLVVFYTFTPNGYLLNIEPNSLVFFKNYISEFDDIAITFTDQNGRPFEIEDKFNLKRFINKYILVMHKCYSIEPRRRKYVKGYGFFSEIYLTNAENNCYMLLQK